MKRKPPKPPSRSRYPDDRYSDDYSDRSDSYSDDREDQPKPKSGIAAALNWTTMAILGAIFVAGLG